MIMPTPFIKTSIFGLRKWVRISGRLELTFLHASPVTNKGCAIFVCYSDWCQKTNVNKSVCHSNCKYILSVNFQFRVVTSLFRTHDLVHSPGFKASFGYSIVKDSSVDLGVNSKIVQIRPTVKAVSTKISKKIFAYFYIPERK